MSSSDKHIVPDGKAIHARRLPSRDLRAMFERVLQFIDKDTRDPFHTTVNELLSKEASVFLSEEDPLTPETITTLEQLVARLIYKSKTSIDRDVLYRLYSAYNVVAETPFSNHLRAHLDTIIHTYEHGEPPKFVYCSL